MLGRAVTLIKEALRDGRIEAVYQPIVNFKNNNIIYTEALVRVTDENGNITETDIDKLVWEAEVSNLVKELYDAMTDKVRQFILDTGAFGAGRIIINISPRQFENDKFWADTLMDGLRENNIDMGKIAFEVTEKWFISDIENTRANILKLKSFGLPVIMGNYGSGNTSLINVKKLPFNAVKLDRNVAREIFNHSENEVFYRQSLQNLNMSNISIIGNGVESLADYRDLKTLGVTGYQGFFISKPMTQDEYIIWIRNTKENLWKIQAS